MSFYLEFIFPPCDRDTISELNYSDRTMIESFFFICFYCFYQPTQKLKESSSFDVEPDLEKYLFWFEYSYLGDNLIA